MSKEEEEVEVVVSVEVEVEEWKWKTDLLLDKSVVCVNFLEERRCSFGGPFPRGIVQVDVVDSKLLPV